MKTKVEVKDRSVVVHSDVNLSAGYQNLVRKLSQIKGVVSFDKTRYSVTLQVGEMFNVAEVKKEAKKLLKQLG